MNLSFPILWKRGNNQFNRLTATTKSVTTRILFELKLNRNSVVLFAFSQYVKLIRESLEILTSIYCRPEVEGRVYFYCKREKEYVEI